MWPISSRTQDARSSCTPQVKIKRSLQTVMMKQSFSTHATSKEWKTVAMPVHQKVFVDRYAEVFDIFGTSFLSSANDPSTKFFLPVATQIMGTGKSALGQHAISVLHRPRESPEDEDDVASRLASSSVLLESVDNKSLLQRAKALPHDETLVCRALREYARTTANLTVAQADARVDTLKQSQTVLIQCETVSPDLPRFDQAIADSIYRNVTGTTWPGSLPPSVHSVHDHLRDYGSLFFFFDEVADFEKDMYSRYFESAMGESYSSRCCDVFLCLCPCSLLPLLCSCRIVFEVLGSFHAFLPVSIHSLALPLTTFLPTDDCSCACSRICRSFRVVLGPPLSSFGALTMMSPPRMYVFVYCMWLCIHTR